jgi:hypothetical protein
VTHSEGKLLTAARKGILTPADVETLSRTGAFRGDELAALNAVALTTAVRAHPRAGTRGVRAHSRRKAHRWVVTNKFGSVLGHFGTSHEAVEFADDYTLMYNDPTLVKEVTE